MKFKRPSPEKTKEITSKFQVVGAALLLLDMEDSHSGNISTRWEDDGAVHMAITATGSQKGDLRETDISYPGIDRTTFGHYKSSSETDIHAAVLAIPGVEGVIHAHTKNAVIETFNDCDKPPKEPMPPMRPVDSLGYHKLGEIPIEWFSVPSGSPEMARLIPDHLRCGVSMIIHGHGAVCRGRTVEEAFHYICLVESAGTVLWSLRQFGIDSRRVADFAYAEPQLHFPVVPPPYTTDADGVCDFDDEPDTRDEFLKTGRRIFESRISPFHTGALSLRGSRTLLYAPKASMPRGLPGPLLERPLAANPSDDAELEFHKRIYANSNFQSIAHAFCAEAEAVAWAAHPRFNDGVAALDGKFLYPIDAEGTFLYPKTPILQPDADFDTVLRALHDYHIIIIRGRGVWTVGSQSLSEVLHHISSLRDICVYRAGAALRRLNFVNLEQERAKNW